MIGSLTMRRSVAVLLVGMLAGIVMGYLTKFRAQARVCLSGLYYRPAAGTTTLAKVQVWLHMIGAILFPAGVAVVLLKGDSFIAAPRRVGR
jgi:hypothetical protein